MRVTLCLPCFLLLLASRLRDVSATPAPPGCLSFFGVSDTHLGKDPAPNPNKPFPRPLAAYTSAVWAVDEMNSMPAGNLTWPATLGGGPVYDPVGVIHGGDLVDDGYSEEWMWTSYTHLFGADTCTAHNRTNPCPRLRWPVIAEGHGNHDGSNTTHEDSPGGDGGWFVDKFTVLRNQLRQKKGMVSEVSANGLHVSWDWPFACDCAAVNGSCSAHLVHLGLYAGDTCHGCGDDGQKCFYGRACYGGFVYPEDSYSFLEADLAAKVGSSGRPVMIVQHYGFDGFSTAWYSPAERLALFQLLRQYNVIGIFVGHTHVPQIYKWNGTAIGGDDLDGFSFDVYNLDATVKAEPGVFAVELWGNGTFRLAHRQTNATASRWGTVQLRKAVALEKRCPELAEKARADAYVQRGEVGAVDPVMMAEELEEQAAVNAKMLQREAANDGAMKHGVQAGANVPELIKWAHHRRHLRM